jgi:mannosyltransferase
MKDLLERVAPKVALPGTARGREGSVGSPGLAVAQDAQSVWSRPSRAVVGATTRLVNWRHFDAFLLAFLAALALGLRWRTLWTNYWGDEAIAIGIAAQPLHTLPRALVNDGSPPLYYVMLHFWMELFGRSEPATHSLSMAGALAGIPVSWWCGGKLFGRWAARAAAALVATCAYVGYYSTETRMYSWLVLGALVAVTCFVLAYGGAGRRYWVAAVAAMTAVLYTHYYGLYLLGALALVGAAAAMGTRSFRRLRATMLYGLACAVAFAPWVPQFAYQFSHTGAPWAPTPRIPDLFADPFNVLASAAWPAVVVAIAFAVLGRRQHLPTGSASHSAVPGALRLLAPAEDRALGPSGTGSRAMPSCPGTSLMLVSAVPLVTLALAWTGSQFVNSWDPRYLGVAVVPALLPLAGGLARVRGGLLVLCGTVVALAATAVPVLVGRGVTIENSKSDVAYVLGRLHGLLRPGDLVISAQVTDAPAVALDLGPKFSYATPLGRLADPLVVNWSNLPTRLQSINAASNLAPLLDALPRGHHVLLVDPTSWDRAESPQRYAGLVEAEAVAANNEVLSDPSLQVLVTETVPRFSDPQHPMQATLFVKTAGR